MDFGDEKDGGKREGERLGFDDTGDTFEERSAFFDLVLHDE